MLELVRVILRMFEGGRLAVEQPVCHRLKGDGWGRSAQRGPAEQEAVSRCILYYSFDACYAPPRASCRVAYLERLVRARDARRAWQIDIHLARIF